MLRYRQIESRLQEMPEAELTALLKSEMAQLKPRRMVVLRVHQRLSSARMRREREELLAQLDGVTVA